LLESSHEYLLKQKKKTKETDEDVTNGTNGALDDIGVNGVEDDIARAVDGVDGLTIS